MRMQSLVPMLQTMDMAATKTWYEKVLGFCVSNTWGEDWCRLSRDGAEIMFMTNAHFTEARATAVQCITVDDVMALWEMVKIHCDAEWGPEEMPYGMLEFAIKDPNGYLLSFAQPIGG
jgi:predicted enzyme related to lactoylglutathione lyase